MARREPPVCDYEGSRYRSEFWGQGREYEDAVERVALRALLPPAGHRLIEVGAGYGRLVPLYTGYETVVLLDYALSQLRQAREMWGDAGPGKSPRYVYVAANFYHLPFVHGLFDTLVMVRTLHHAADVPAVLRGVADILAPQGRFVLEFANKRNLKAVLRYLLGRQDWSPFEREPVEFAELNFDFHPAWMLERLSEAGLSLREVRAVSYLRVGLLKRAVPTKLLVALDRVLQPTGSLCQLSPSVFARCVVADGKPAAQEGLFFRCTACGSSELVEQAGAVGCADCGARFAVHDGIYDFRAPLEGGDA